MWIRNVAVGDCDFDCGSCCGKKEENGVVVVVVIAGVGVEDAVISEGKKGCCCLMPGKDDPFCIFVFIWLDNAIAVRCQIFPAFMQLSQFRSGAFVYCTWDQKALIDCHIKTEKSKTEIEREKKDKAKKPTRKTRDPTSLTTTTKHERKTNGSSTYLAKIVKIPPHSDIG